MSDEHGWPDFSHQDGPGDDGGHHDTGDHEQPAAEAGSPFHDDLFGHDDPHGYDTHDGAGPDPHDLDPHDLDQDGGQDPAGGWDDLHEPGTGHDDVDAQPV